MFLQTDNLQFYTIRIQECFYILIIQVLEN